MALKRKVKTVTTSASNSKSKKPVYIEIPREKSPHYQEFDPRTISLGGFPYAIEVETRSDESMVIKRGSIKEDVSPPAVQCIRDSGLNKLRERLIDDLKDLGPRELELWICKHLLT